MYPLVGGEKRERERKRESKDGKMKQEILKKKKKKKQGVENSQSLTAIYLSSINPYPIITSLTYHATSLTPFSPFPSPSPSSPPLLIFPLPSPAPLDSLPQPLHETRPQLPDQGRKLRLHEYDHALIILLISNQAQGVGFHRRRPGAGLRGRG